MSHQDASAVLRIDRLSKTFTGQTAVDRVSIEVRSGEVHALVGQNGCGKSTLIKVLSGFHTADPGGRVSFAGRDVELAAGAARDPRMRFIHQDLGLVGTLDAVDNIALGRGYQVGRSRRINWRSRRAEAQRALARLGHSLDLRAPVAELPAVDRTMIAVARATIDWDTAEPGLLVLDEPTVSLPLPAVQQLFASVRRLKQEGVGVLYVSHRLDEVFEISDRISVMRDGRLMATSDTAALDHDSLVELIVGRRLARFEAPELEKGDEPAIRVRDLVAGSLRGVSFDLYPGEILGVAGLVGSGMEELAEVLFGAKEIDEGEIAIYGDQVQTWSPRLAKRKGVGFVPADRPRKGCIPEHSVRWNLTLPDLAPVRARFKLSRARENREVRHWVRRVDLRPPAPERSMKELSGGNQQKVVVAKWLRLQPRVLLLDEPTQGVDVGAKSAIWGLIVEAARDGTAVLVCSSDLEDLSKLCSRVLVLRDGELLTQLSGVEVTTGSLTRAMFQRPARTTVASEGVPHG